MMLARAYVRHVSRLDIEGLAMQDRVTLLDSARDLYEALPEAEKRVVFAYRLFVRRETRQTVLARLQSAFGVSPPQAYRDLTAALSLFSSFEKPRSENAC
jgi:hypothetical protein